MAARGKSFGGEYGNSHATIRLSQPGVDLLCDILKWILLAVAVICFALSGWVTVHLRMAPHSMSLKTGRAT
jgi:hypothetical protein